LPDAVRVLVEQGPNLVEKVLMNQVGVPFDRDATTGDLPRTREGGHSVFRILHVGDAPGRAIEAALIKHLQTLPNVTLYTGHTAVDLITSSHHSRDPLAVYQPITCHGVYIFDRSNNKIDRFLAPATVLATGGVGRIYRHTTNPAGARGDGLAMAYRAGARVINAEYIQFHPPTLAVPGMDNFLISEAVRGEGAKLFTPDVGTRLPARFVGFGGHDGCGPYPQTLPHDLCNVLQGGAGHHRRANPRRACRTLFLRWRPGGCVGPSRWG